jgi:hypothetical protein
MALTAEQIDIIEQCIKTRKKADYIAKEANCTERTVYNYKKNKAIEKATQKRIGSLVTNSVVANNPSKTQEIIKQNLELDTIMKQNQIVEVNNRLESIRESHQTRLNALDNRRLDLKTRYELLRNKCSTLIEDEKVSFTDVVLAEKSLIEIEEKMITCEEKYSKIESELLKAELEILSHLGLSKKSIGAVNIQNNLQQNVQTGEYDGSGNYIPTAKESESVAISFKIATNQDEYNNAVADQLNNAVEAEYSTVEN